jgi:predicted helicase
MRWNLLNAFDKIYILDLHGSTKKRETAPDGSKDENIFDIQVGVSINLLIKTGKKKAGELAEVYHYDMYGDRETKYLFLLQNTLSTIGWHQLPNEAPQYFFVEKDFTNKDIYEKGFSIVDLYTINSMGITTANDEVFINSDNDLLLENIHNYFKIEPNKNFVKNIAYRPFDNKLIYYDINRLARPRKKVMRHFQNGNFSLCLIRVNRDEKCTVLITSYITDKTILSPKDNSNVFPLYLYPFDGSNERTPNLNKNIIQNFSVATELQFTNEKEDDEKTFAPIDILDYVYAVLYSNNYRKKYTEFLKIDFPRIPYPQNVEQFYKLAAAGSILRNLHLMENVSPSLDLADFPVVGSNEIETVHYKGSKVFINKTQYFSDIPPEAWHYFIGGYQPSEKWLKDRKGRILSFDDIEHYRKIIFVLITTINIQRQIDEMLV